MAEFESLRSQTLSVKELCGLLKVQGMKEADLEKFKGGYSGDKILLLLDNQEELLKIGISPAGVTLLNLIFGQGGSGTVSRKGVERNELRPQETAKRSYRTSSHTKHTRTAISQSSARAIRTTKTKNTQLKHQKKDIGMLYPTVFPRKSLRQPTRNVMYRVEEPVKRCLVEEPVIKKKRYFWDDGSDEHVFGRHAE